MHYVALTSRFGLGLIFLAALAGKSRDWTAFRTSVTELAPHLPPRPAAVTVVLLEAATVLLLVVRPAAGFVLAAATLLAFSAALWSALRRGSTASCRCFGVNSAPLSPAQLVRNALLVALAAAGLVTLSDADTHPAGVAVCLITAAVLAALFVFFDDLADLLVIQRKRTA